MFVFCNVIALIITAAFAAINIIYSVDKCLWGTFYPIFNNFLNHSHKMEEPVSPSLESSMSVLI